MKNKRNLTIAAVVLVILLGISAFVYLKSQSNEPPATPRDTNSVDYGGPTEDEKKAGDAQKENNVEREKIDSAAKPSNANIVVVDSSQYDAEFEIRAYVSNVFENNGTCVATFTKEGASPVSASSQAESSSTNTSCKPIVLPISSFTSKGQWQLVVSYNSSTMTGQTKPKGVEIK